MEAIKMIVTGTQALVTQAPTVTSGTVGLPVEISFDPYWDTLEKTLVFRAGTVSRAQTEVTDCAVVPWEVLAQSGHTLRIGVCGVGENGEVLPTIWASVGLIQEGADPGADPSLQPQNPLWANVAKKPKLIWELRVPGTAQGFSHTQNWCDEDRQFAVTDDSEHDIPWNLAWWQDPELPADTTLRKVFESLFHNLKGHRAVCMEVEINSLFSMTGYPFYACQELVDGPVESLLLMVPNTDMSQTFVHDLVTVELRKVGLFNSAHVGQLALAYGWNVRVYAQEV